MRSVFLGFMATWLVILIYAGVLFYMSRQCHGQCFQTHDKGCQQRCFDKGLCPMAGGDQ
jgi:hypothetical protein